MKKQNCIQLVFYSHQTTMNPTAHQWTSTPANRGYQTSEPENQHTSEPGIQRTNEPDNQRTSESMNWGSSKPTNQLIVNQRIRGDPANQQTNEPANQITSEPVNQRTSEAVNKRTSKSVNQPANQWTNQQTSEPAYLQNWETCRIEKPAVKQQTSAHAHWMCRSGTWCTLSLC